MKTIRVVYKEPGKDPEIKEIFDELEVFQNLVGGWIEHVTLKPGIGLIMNEEGKLHGMEPNFYLQKLNDMIVGPAVFVGEDGEEFCSLTEDQAEMIALHFTEV